MKALELLVRWLERRYLRKLEHFVQSSPPVTAQTHPSRRHRTVQRISTA